MKYIRRIIEQGINFNNYTNEEIMLMMNHINNTKREKLNSITPFKLMSEKNKTENIKKLEFYYTSPQDIILNSSYVFYFY